MISLRWVAGNKTVDIDEVTAFHEAGHVFAALWLGGRVLSASISPDNDDGPGRSGDTVVAWDPQELTKREIAEKSAIVALAGPVAEMIHRQKPFHPALVAEWQADWRLGLNAMQHVPNIKRRLAHLEQATIDLYQVFNNNDHWAAIGAIADHLLAHEILEEDMLLEIVEPWMPGES